ncbi:C4-dicarboxylate ABC transporter [Roseomonas stagni]|uniref:C4-dicarboxylate ABC transporter n=1 Tax=Falsiroseomonas algicola TaxID=2716930 RepID=A0A6M1LGE8_9PROT|nr:MULTISPECIES: C4-dicarboxylate ABC transporter [Acetobacteraceae]NGM19363.1 C4-dicarboxylate ABC transporter [Falsiroseomonas algicola]
MKIDRVMRTAPTLAFLPLPLLAMPMGLGGAGLAWRQAAQTLGVPGLVGEALLALTFVVWLGIVAAQAARWWRHPDAFAQEAANPVRLAFLAAPTIGFMIVSAAAWPYAPRLGAALWAMAVPLHLLVAMLLLRRVLLGRADAAMLAPPLLIPFVGNILAPALGARMGFLDASWMMFGVGLLLWLIMMPLLLHRFFAGPKLPAPLLPSVAIFLAPPAVGALALVALTGQAGGASLSLTGLAVLIAAVLLSMARHFAALPFSIVWWSFTFPAAAFAILLMVEDFHPALCWAALAIATGITGYVAWRTAMAAAVGTFFQPEGH